ncbi:hypothetical protein SMICM17S_01015 [Streptomyces microflavus]
MDQRSYSFWLTQIMTEAHRLTKTGGAALLFTDWRQLPTTTDAIQAAGWLWRGVLAWHKPQAGPSAEGLPKTVSSSCGPARARSGSRNPVYLPGMYSASQPSGSKRQHITQKPVSVMRELVKISPPGGTILDFCAGSGSTAHGRPGAGRRPSDVKGASCPALIPRPTTSASPGKNSTSTSTTSTPMPGSTATSSSTSR